MNIHYIMATDTFPGVALSANYTIAEGTFTVAANKCTGASSGATGDIYGYRNSEAYADDQYSKVNITTVLAGSSKYVEIIVRFSGQQGVGSGMNGYLLYTDGGNSPGCAISKWVNDVQTDLQQLSSNFTIGSDILIEIIGKNIFIYKNKTRFGSNQTDSSILSGGTPGIGCTVGGAFNTAEFGNCAYPFALWKPDALRSQITR